MTRGRKKDLSIPPTRALVQQRDYRARKAYYIAELEERVRKAEEENVQLRRDLEAARAGLGVPAILFSPQAAEASRELMQHLTLTTNTLTRFQQLAFPEQPSPSTLPSMQLPPPPEFPTQLHPSSFPSPAPSPPYSQTTPQSSFRSGAQPSSSSAQWPTYSLPHLALSYPSGRKRLYREDSPEPPEPPRGLGNVSPHLGGPRRTLSPESECCGGYLDCQDLVEDEKDSEERDRPLGRVSVMRSTSSYAHEDNFKHSD